jgi:hypothetical protein
MQHRHARRMNGIGGWIGINRSRNRLRKRNGRSRKESFNDKVAKAHEADS